MDTFLLITSWACTILLGLSAFFDNWASLSQRPIFHGRPWINTEFLGKTGFKFSWFICLTIASISLTYYSSQRSEVKTRTEIAQRDLVHQKHDDSLQLEYKKDIRATNDSNIRSFSKSLEEYNLTYNEQQKKVQSLIRDSMSREIPSLDVSPGEREIIASVDSLRLNFDFYNSGNCPILINAKIYPASWFSNNRMFVNSYQYGYKNRSLGPTGALALKTSFKVTFMPDKLYFLILGDYSNEKRTIKNKIDNLLEWNIKMNSIGTPTDIAMKDSIEKFIKKHISL